MNGVKKGTEETMKEELEIGKVNVDITSHWSQGAIRRGKRGGGSVIR